MRKDLKKEPRRLLPLNRRYLMIQIKILRRLRRLRKKFRLPNPHLRRHRRQMELKVVRLH
jgi:hypothetical protein